MRLHVEGEFCAAHRLHGHPGKCAHFHGHTYFVQVDLEIPDKDIFKTDKNMAVDFSELEGVFRGHLNVADHKCWLSKKSCELLFGTYSFTKIADGTLRVTLTPYEKDFGIIVTDGEPTAELMARQIYRWLEPDYLKLGKSRLVKISLIGVTVWETDEQGATYAPDL